MTINVSVISHAFFTEKGSSRSQRVHHDSPATSDNFAIENKDNECISSALTSRDGGSNYTSSSCPRDLASPRSTVSNVSNVSNMSNVVGSSPSSPQSKSISSSSTSLNHKSQTKRKGNRKKGGRGKQSASEKSVSDHPKKHSMVSGSSSRHVSIISNNDMVSGLGSPSRHVSINSDDNISGLGSNARHVSLSSESDNISGLGSNARHVSISSNDKEPSRYVAISSGDKEPSRYVAISSGDKEPGLPSRSVLMGNVDNMMSGMGSSTRNVLIANVDMVSSSHPGKASMMNTNDLVSGERNVSTMSSNDIMVSSGLGSSSGDVLRGNHDMVSNASCDEVSVVTAGADEAEVLMREVSEECSSALGIVKEDLEFYGLCHLPRSMDRATLLKDKSGIMHVGVMVRNSDLNLQSIEELVIQKDKAEQEAENYRLQITQKTQDFEELRLKYDKLTEEVLHLRTMLTRATQLRKESEKATELLRLEFEKLVKNLLLDHCSEVNQHGEEGEEEHKG